MNNNKIFLILRDIIGVIIIISITYIIFNYQGLYLMISSSFANNNYEYNINNNEKQTLIIDEETNSNFILYNNSESVKRNRDNNLYIGNEKVKNTTQFLNTITLIDKDINSEIEEKLEDKRKEILQDKKIDNQNNGIRVNRSNSNNFFELSFDMTNEEKKLYGNDSYIVIPKISVVAPIYYPNIDTKNLENHIMDLLEKGVVHRPETQLPYQQGNFFILGHSSNYAWINSQYNNIFAKIDFLNLGDEVWVFFEGRKYIYELSEKKIVNPNAIEVYGYIPGYNLSIMTCWPIGSVRQRMIGIFSLKRNI